jgi:hypothetical protein
MASAPVLNDVVEAAVGHDLALFEENTTDVDILDHVDAQEVADGIESILTAIGLRGYEVSIAPDFASIRVEFSSPVAPAVAQSILRLHPRSLACIGQGHSSGGSWFDFAGADESLPTRADDAAERLRSEGFVPTFVLKPSALCGGCACTGAYEDRPTEQPVGLSAFVLDEDGDPLLSSVFVDRATALSGIEAQMEAEGIDSWVVIGDDGVPEIFGAAAVALEEDGDGLLDEPLETDVDRLDRQADQHEWEKEREGLVADDPSLDAELAEIDQDAHLRALPRPVEMRLAA